MRITLNLNEVPTELTGEIAIIRPTNSNDVSCPVCGTGATEGIKYTRGQDATDLFLTVGSANQGTIDHPIHVHWRRGFGPCFVPLHVLTRRYAQDIIKDACDIEACTMSFRGIELLKDANAVPALVKFSWVGPDCTPTFTGSGLVTQADIIKAKTLIWSQVFDNCKRKYNLDISDK